MRKILDPLAKLWARLDPKLKYTILSLGVAYATTKGLIHLDATESAVVAGAIGSYVGYQVPNDGTVKRRESTVTGDVPDPPSTADATADPLAGINVTGLT